MSEPADKHGEFWAIYAAVATVLAVLFLDGSISRLGPFRWILGCVFALAAVAYTFIAALACRDYFS